MPFIRPCSSINFTSLDVATYFTGAVAADFPDYGIGYFDNYKVVAITVPEPNPIFSTAIGTVVLLAFRCSKAGRNRPPPS
jgi:hypothetical protein